MKIMSGRLSLTKSRDVIDYLLSAIDQIMYRVFYLMHVDTYKERIKKPL